MVVIVLDHSNSSVYVHHGVPKGLEEGYILSLYKETNVSWLSVKEEDFEVSHYNYSEVIKYVN